jgi:hypothetical protein
MARIAPTPENAEPAPAGEPWWAGAPHKLHEYAAWLQNEYQQTMQDIGKTFGDAGKTIRENMEQAPVNSIRRNVIDPVEGIGKAEDALEGK